MQAHAPVPWYCNVHATFPEWATSLVQANKSRHTPMVFGKNWQQDKGNWYSWIEIQWKSLKKNELVLTCVSDLDNLQPDLI